MRGFASAPNGVGGAGGGISFEYVAGRHYFNGTKRSVGDTGNNQALDETFFVPWPVYGELTIAGLYVHQTSSDGANPYTLNLGVFDSDGVSSGPGSYLGGGTCTELQKDGSMWHVGAPRVASLAIDVVGPKLIWLSSGPSVGGENDWLWTITEDASPWPTGDGDPDLGDGDMNDGGAGYWSDEFGPADWAGGFVPVVGHAYTNSNVPIINVIAG